MSSKQLLDVVGCGSAFACAADGLGVLRWEVFVVLGVEKVQELRGLGSAHLFAELLLACAVGLVLGTERYRDPTVRLKQLGSLTPFRWGSGTHPQ
jgi:hypothetical protein